ncbi:MAG: DUF3791 domain-containing protein, partial [Clostridia bacterium]|nr:DUF3791 domain-containing protein [Clostridia bacterium]
MSKEAFSFVIYMIHICAEKWQLSPAQTYQKMSAAGCIDGYLVPHYEVLHTQSSDYVA